MKIKVLNQEKDLLLQTVSLRKNNDNPDNMYYFRCPYCSTGIAQVQGDVLKIMPGLTPTEDVPVINECRKCKRLYTFQTLNYLPGVDTKVILISVPKTIGIYHCWICRNQLLQFMDNKIIKMPDFKLVQIPFTINCVNMQCPARYTIADMI